MVTGGSSGIGKATVRALVAEGARVTAVARGADGLRALGDDVATVRGDASDAALAERLLRELKPDLVVLAAGVNPTMGRLDELDWDSFSEAWNADLKATFHFLKHALSLPLAPGSTIVVVSSGAALNGSPLSGGYAGAKRMQWWLADYAQRVSDQRSLGLRVVAVLPEQLVAGTAIGTKAATVYGAMSGTSAEAFFKRYDAQLDADGVASVIMKLLRGELSSSVAVKGTGLRTLP